MSKIDRTEVHSCLRPPFFGVVGIGVLVVIILEFAIARQLGWWSALALVAALAMPVGVLGVMGALICETWAKMVFNRIHYSCPNCKHQGPPKFRCSGCGEVVEDLGPTVHGLWRVRCYKCSTELPTVDRAGRLDLTKVCEKCLHDLKHADLGRVSEYHIAVVGATSAGKTNLMWTSIWQLKASFAPKNHFEVSFGNPDEERDFSAHVKALEAGQVMTKTASLVPKAFLLSLKSKELNGSMLYIYDAAGEAFPNPEILGEHPVGRYDGVLFVIDPLAEEGIHKGVLGDCDENEVANSNPAPVTASEILGNLIGVLERKLGVAVDTPIDLPIAIVISKIDACGLDRRLQLGQSDIAHTYCNMKMAAHHAERYSRQVRSTLLRVGMGNFVRMAESRFARVAYFAASALGRSGAGSSKRGFQPQGVLAPLVWLGYFVDALSDIDPFDRTFVNWHIYFTRCMQGREKTRAAVISWGLIAAILVGVLGLFLRFPFDAVLLCGGVQFLLLAFGYTCMYFILIRGRYKD
ncbi:MAG: hypothetical protein WCJ35_07340 [Planctomycetota bacterium]